MHLGLLPRKIMKPVWLPVQLLIMVNWMSRSWCEMGKKFGESGPVKEIETLQGFPTCQEFFLHYALPSKPMKMEGAAKLSPAFDKWSDDYFLSRTESSEIMVNVETRKKENRTVPTIDISFKEFVEQYNDSDSYMVDPVPDFLRNEVLLPGPLQCQQIIDNYMVENIMWYSSGGTKSVVHTDAVDNIICLYSGEKTFIMVDPEKYGENVDIDHPEGAYSDIDVDNVDYEKYPGLVGIEFYSTKLESGDCLFIPYKWIHQVRSYNRNIAVNVWWDHHNNQQIDLANCPASLDPSLTLDKVSFISFPELMSTVDSLRDQFHDFSQRAKPLTLKKFVKMLAGDQNGNAGDGFMVPLKQVFKLIDANYDGILHPNEVLTTIDSDWEEIQKHMDRFEAVMQAIAARMYQDSDIDDQNYHEEL